MIETTRWEMNTCPEAAAQYPNVEVWWANLHVENFFGLGGLGTQASPPSPYLSLCSIAPG